MLSIVLKTLFVLTLLSKLDAVPRECLEQIQCPLGDQTIHGSCQDNLIPLPCNGTFHPSDDPNSPPCPNGYYINGRVGSNRQLPCGSTVVDYCCASAAPRGWCCPLRGGGDVKQTPTPGEGLIPTPGTSPTTQPTQPVEKRCEMFYRGDQNKFVGRCVFEGSGPVCNSDRDCQVKTCITKNREMKCELSDGGTRPCFTDDDCRQPFCDVRITGGQISSVCRLAGNTSVDCDQDPSVCQTKRCDTFIPQGDVVGYPVCVVGGRGRPCNSAIWCRSAGSRCEYFYEGKRLVGICIHGGSSNVPCRYDADCNNRERRCDDFSGKCVFGGLGALCGNDLDCNKKYCGRDNQCVSSRDPSAKPYECSNDDDCKDLDKKRCKETRTKDGSIIVQCVADGDGEVCRKDSDCQNLPKRCKKFDDGSLRCVRGYFSDAPLCSKDRDCQIYRRVCDYSGRCVSPKYPSSLDYPCSSDNDCKYPACERDTCKLRNGVGIPQCRSDEECAIVRQCVNSTCLELPGQGAHQCTKDSDCAGGGLYPVPTPGDNVVISYSQKLNVSQKMKKGPESIKRLGRIGMEHQALDSQKTLVRSILAESNRIFSGLSSKNDKKYIITFNDVTCGMSRRLIEALFSDQNQSKANVILIPMTLGGSQEDHKNQIISFACISKTYASDETKQIVKKLFSRDTEGETVQEKFENLAKDQEEMLAKYRDCVTNNQSVHKSAEIIAAAMQKLNVNGTPTTYVTDKEVSTVIDYSGFRDDFWENLPEMPENASRRKPRGSLLDF